MGKRTPPTASVRRKCAFRTARRSDRRRLRFPRPRCQPPSFLGGAMVSFSGYFGPLVVAAAGLVPLQAAPGKQPPPIPVVNTWADLLGQPAIDLGDGVKLRLGMEANRCPRGACVLIYAYTEGYDD